jgi:hypothetical protein
MDRPDHRRELRLRFLDVVAFFIRRSVRFEHWRRVFAYGRITAAAAMLYVPTRVLIDTAWVQDPTVDVRLKNLPGELQDFRILVGDIHGIGTPASPVAQVPESFANRPSCVSSGDGDWGN